MSCLINIIGAGLRISDLYTIEVTKKIDIMSTDHIYLKDLHEDHKKWLNEVKLYDEEILSFENRLGEVVMKNTDKDLLANLEHLQNSLIRHKEVSDILKHDITVHEQALANFAKENQTAIHRKHFEDHPELRDKVHTERKLFGELKDELKEFLAKSL